MGKVFEQYKKYIIKGLKAAISDADYEEAEIEAYEAILPLIPDCKDLSDIQDVYGDMFSDELDYNDMIDFINNY